MSFSSSLHSFGAPALSYISSPKLNKIQTPGTFCSRNSTLWDPDHDTRAPRHNFRKDRINERRWQSHCHAIYLQSSWILRLKNLSFLFSTNTSSQTVKTLVFLQSDSLDVGCRYEPACQWGPSSPLSSLSCYCYQNTLLLSKGRSHSCSIHSSA